LSLHPISYLLDVLDDQDSLWEAPPPAQSP